MIKDKNKNKNKIQKKFILKDNNNFHATFNNYDDLEKFAENWSFSCKYRFGKRPLSGVFDIYQYDDFQLVHVSYEDGLMYNGYAPDNTLSVIVIVKSNANICLNRIKMNEHEVLVFDSNKKYEIVFSEPLTMGVISIKKSFIKLNFPKLLDTLDSTFKDSELALTKLTIALKNNIPVSKESFIEALHVSINTENVLTKELTNGEKKAFETRDYILSELENDININLLSERANVSDKTMQSSFKELFGFPPKRFIHIMRLNLAHRDLTQNKELSVSNISLKYGFKNFGRFAKQYKEIFGVLPSKVSTSYINTKNHIGISCLKVEDNLNIT